MSMFSEMSSGISSINGSVKNSLRACLLLKGFDLSLVDQIMAMISDVFSQEDMDELEEEIDAIEEDAANDIQNNAEAVNYIENNFTNTVNQSQAMNEVQDNPTSFKVPELPVLSKMHTSIPDNFPAGSNATSEDYPNTYGAIDEAKNWYKINKTSKYTEFVHNSGCSLKIDKSGNASIHITGNLKFIVDKDFLMNSIGNLDIHSKASCSLVSSNNMDIKSNAPMTVKSNASLDINAASSFSASGGGSASMSSSGSSSITSSGGMSINSESGININSPSTKAPGLDH